MMEGTYYKEWSAVLDREMEFKVYGHGGVPVLALPARGGRFYDWENNGMPDAAARLLHEGKIQLFCADSIDGESLLAGNESPRRRAEMQEKYFVYLTSELAARIAELNAPESKEKPLIWCVGVDTGAYQAVQCRLRRPRTFAGAMGLSGLYDMGRFLGSAEDDLVLRSSPLAALRKNGICDRNVLSKAEENSLLLCVGQGGYEGDALLSLSSESFFKEVLSPYFAEALAESFAEEENLTFAYLQSRMKKGAFSADYLKRLNRLTSLPLGVNFAHLRFGVAERSAIKMKSGISLSKRTALKVSH